MIGLNANPSAGQVTRTRSCAVGCCTRGFGTKVSTRASRWHRHHSMPSNARTSKEPAALWMPIAAPSFPSLHPPSSPSLFVGPKYTVQNAKPSNTKKAPKNQENSDQPRSVHGPFLYPNRAPSFTPARATRCPPNIVAMRHSQNATGFRIPISSWGRQVYTCSNNVL